MELEPIHPSSALELYLTDKENESAQATLYSHNSRLGHFTRWCEENDIENLNVLTGRKLQEYRIWRRNEGNLKPVSEKTQMDTLRVFVRWLESIDAVERDLSTKVLSPSISPNQNTSEEILKADRADSILGHLAKYEYATIAHVTLALMWHTMARIGGVHALDVSDYHPQNQYLEIRHRPDTETPLKNKEDGERLVAISDEISALLDDWLETQRPEVQDDFGREPLLASYDGRTHTTTLRSYVYRWSQPCRYTNECPHDRTVDNCEARHRDHLPKCPSVVNPHAIRRGSITNALNNDVPEKVVSDRANVSPKVIDQHYDSRTDREKMEQRRGYLDNI